MNNSEKTLNKIVLGGIGFNMNRDDDQPLIDNFDNLMIEYDETNGPHFVFNNAEGDAIIVPIQDSYLDKMYGFDHHDLPVDYEYPNQTFFKYIDQKNDHVREMIRKIYALGLQKPSEIQKISIPEIIKGVDTICQGKSGTGKTFSLLISTLWHFNILNPKLQFMYITISHEVAQQFYKSIKDLLPSEAKVVLCIGEGKKDRTSGGFRSAPTKSLAQLRAEAAGAQVIIGTIGKIKEYITSPRPGIQPAIDPSYMITVGIDEFDAIVKPNSNKNMNKMYTDFVSIMRQIPNGTQRIFFSATVTPIAAEQSETYFRREGDTYCGMRSCQDVVDPFVVFLDKDDTTLDCIKQFYVECRNNNDKYSILIDLLSGIRYGQCIVFANSKDTVIRIHDYLSQDKIESEMVYGEFENRKEVSNKLSSTTGGIRLVISTDVFSRGLDIQGVGLVINFDMPQHLETYIHRIGRSGRYGRKGLAISLIIKTKENDEMLKVKEINLRSKTNKMEALPADFTSLL